MKEKGAGSNAVHVTDTAVVRYKMRAFYSQLKPGPPSSFGVSLKAAKLHRREVEDEESTGFLP